MPGGFLTPRKGIIVEVDDDLYNSLSSTSSSSTSPSSSSSSSDSSSTVSTELYSPRQRTLKSPTQTFDSSFSSVDVDAINDVDESSVDVDAINDVDESSVDVDATNDVDETDEGVDRVEVLEVDYDVSPTKLYTHIQNKEWEEAAATAKAEPTQIRTWVFRTEEADKEKLRWRLLPIHAVCIFDSPDQLVDLLLDNYPAAATLTDDQGMLPIHLACRNGASKGIVKLLLDAYPESLDIVDRKNRTPADFVRTSKHFNKEGVSLVLERFVNKTDSSVSSTSKTRNDGESLDAASSESRDAVTKTISPKYEVDYEHRTMLVRHLMKKEWAKSSRRCEEYPDEAATWIVANGINGEIRFLPLHKACVLDPPQTTIDSLILSYPDGAKSSDQDGWLPIHCASFYGASESVVKALLTSYPRGSKTKDEDGRLPIHYVCSKKGSIQQLEPLLTEFPKGAKCKDNDGLLPIHLACSNGSSSEVIKALLKASPKCAQSKDDEGRLPLHHACQGGATDEVIKLLIAAFPRGSKVQDDQGKLAMHYACENPEKKSTINILLDDNPESVNIRDNFGYTPMATAKAAKGAGKMAVVETLTAASQDETEDGENAAPPETVQSAIEKKLLDRIAALEMTVQSFAKVTKDMQASFAINADNVLGNRQQA